MQVYDLVTGFQYLDFTELEFGGDESDSWRWMFDDYYGYLTNQKTWGVLTQEGETVVLVPQLSYNEPDPSQQWTLDYNGLTQPSRLPPPSLFVFQCMTSSSLLPKPGGGPQLTMGELCLLQ